MKKEFTIEVDGRRALAPKEKEVLKLLSTGLRTSEIAEKMNVSRKTTETHMMHAQLKMGLRDFFQLRAVAALLHAELKVRIG